MIVRRSWGRTREDEGVRLVEDDGQREDDRAVRRDLDRGEERLGDPERQRHGRVRGQRVVGDVEQQRVLPEAEREGDAERQQRDDHPVAQLVEVIDESQPIVELGACRLQARHGVTGARAADAHVRAVLDDLALDGLRARLGLWLKADISSFARSAFSSSSSLLFPVIESLNSRMPLPSDEPSSGSRLGPNTSKAMTSTIAICQMEKSITRDGLGPRPGRSLPVEIEMKRDGVGSSWPWYFEPVSSDPYGRSTGDPCA